MMISLRPLTLFLCSVFLTALPVIASKDAGVFSAANIDYAGARYEDAIRKYESLISQEKYSPNLFFNLGNAYARNNQIGLALLNYKRALYLSPSEPDAQANLKFITDNEGIQLPSPPMLLKYTSALPPGTWLILSCLFLVVLCALGIARTLKKEIPPVLRRNSIMTALIFLYLFTLCSGLYARKNFDYAVIIAPETALTISPVPNAQLVGILPDGSFVRPLKEHGDHVMVETLNNQKGWIPRSTVKNILIEK